MPFRVTRVRCLFATAFQFGIWLLVCDSWSPWLGGQAAEPPTTDTGFNRPQQDLAGWERPKRDLLSGFSNMYQPCVVQVPDKEYPFRMWFFGWAVGVGNKGYPGVDAIFHARSKDLGKWEVYAGTKEKQDRWDDKMDPKQWVPVVTAGDKPYDEVHNGDPSVVYKDGRYYMAFSSSGSLKKVKFHPDDMLDCVMGATSDDGIRWTKTKQPLIIEPPEMQAPKTDEGWTGQYCRPSLMWDEGKWRLWFDYWHPKKGVGYSLGYAENKGDFDAKDGFKVLRAGGKPLLVNWLNPDVVKVGNRYHCFGDAIDPGRSKKFPPEQFPLRHLAICEAVSDDGLDWKVVGFLPHEDDVPSAHVPQATVLKVGGKDALYLFYAAQKGGEPYDYRYDRLRVMHRNIEKPLAPKADDPVKIRPDVVYGRKDGMALTMDVFTPQVANGAGVLFIHSGGWYSIWQDPKNFLPSCQPLLERGFTVFLVYHGSAPRYVVPEAVADVRRAVQFVRLHAAAFGVHPDRLGALGGSAGGHLTLMLATTGDDGNPKAEDKVLRQPSRIAAAVALYPPTDLRAWVSDPPEAVKKVPGLKAPLSFPGKQAAEVSPLLHVGLDTPPICLIHGDRDEMVPVEHSQNLYAELQKAKRPSQLLIVEGAGHVFDASHYRIAVPAMVDWFDKHLSPKARK